MGRQVKYVWEKLEGMWSKYIIQNSQRTNENIILKIINY